MDLQQKSAVVLVRSLVFLSLVFGVGGCNYQSQINDIGDHQIRVLNSTNFEVVVLKSRQPVLVHFWTLSVNANLKARKTLVALSNELDGEVVVGQVDISDEEALASRYQVTATPTFLVFINGYEVDRLEGLKTESQLRKALQEHLQ